MSISPAPTKPAEVAAAAFERLTAGDFDGLAELAHEDIVDDFLPLGERRGWTSVRRFFEELRTAFPDFAIRPEHIIADDRGAAVAWRLAGTFTGGPFEGITPNGRRVELRGVDFMQIDAGRIRHNRIAYDGADFARQIGMLPARGTAADRALLAAFNARTRFAGRLRERRRRAGATRH